MLRVIVMVCDAVRLEASVTVTVTLFTPVAIGMEAIVQLNDPEAIPDAPRSFTQVTRKAPDPPEVVPAMAIAMAVVVTLGLGLVMASEGAGSGAGGGGVP